MNIKTVSLGGERGTPKDHPAAEGLRSFLSSLRGSFDPGSGASLLSAGGGPSSNAELFFDLLARFAPVFEELHGQFERESANVPEAQRPARRRFVQEILHPLIMSAPFVHRSYSKPLGYAGDHEMVRMILRSPEEGPTLYDRLVNAFALATGPARAHRHRIDMLTEKLSFTMDVRPKNLDRPVRILSIGCGPAVEVERFIRRDPRADFCEITLMDFSTDALEQASSLLHLAAKETGRAPGITYLQKSVQELLRKPSLNDPPGAGSVGWDYIYCAGLFDYLSDQLCRRLLRLFETWLSPRGRLLITNVHSDNSARFLMEDLLEWRLEHRDQNQLKALAPTGLSTLVYTDPTGLNVFWEGTRL